MCVRIHPFALAHQAQSQVHAAPTELAGPQLPLPINMALLTELSLVLRYLQAPLEKEALEFH